MRHKPSFHRSLIKEYERCAEEAKSAEGNRFPIIATDLLLSDPRLLCGNKLQETADMEQLHIGSFGLCFDCYIG